MKVPRAANYDASEGAANASFNVLHSNNIPDTTLNHYYYPASLCVILQVAPSPPSVYPLVAPRILVHLV